MTDRLDRQVINKLIEDCHASITKLGDALLAAYEFTEGLNITVLKAEAAKWDAVKGIDLDALKEKAAKYDQIQGLLK